MIEFVFDRKAWDRIDTLQLVEWLRDFCSRDEFEMEQVEDNYFDHFTCNYKSRISEIKMRFADPKVAMAFKLAWVNC